MIDLFEAGKKPLAKLALTGGGRCNLTNSFEGIGSLAQAYPRGSRLMDRLFHEFDHKDCCQWFEDEGVRLITQPDNCVFPLSQDAMQIVRTLLRVLGDGVKLRCSCHISQILPLSGGGFSLFTDSGEEIRSDIVLVTTGGYPKKSGLLSKLELKIEAPLPSLFTFSIKDQITALSGTVTDVTVSLPSTRFKAEGPLLITDWGMSGPAILKLSSYAARYLAENAYKSLLSVNWLKGNDAQSHEVLSRLGRASLKKQVSSTHPDFLTSRLWACLLAKAGLRPEMKWEEMGKSSLNRLCNTLINDQYEVLGKSRFREEFVTCGGVSLDEVSWKSLESKKYPGLYFAGEVLDVDAITGGFNLQAAWTTGYVAAMSIIAKLSA